MVAIFIILAVLLAFAWVVYSFIGPGGTAKEKKQTKVSIPPVSTSQTKVEEPSEPVEESPNN